MSGDWIKSPDFCYWKTNLTEVFGKTIGLVGFGSIGQRVAKIAESFGMNVLVHTRTPDKVDDYNKKVYGNEECSSEHFVKAVTFDQLLEQSNIVSLHCPLTAENSQMINSNTLAKMKNDALLINTARGGLVNEKDIRTALDNGKLAGYATDVIAKEPMAGDCPLFQAPNCIITPHIAWAGKETRIRLLQIALDNFKAFMKGSPINQV